MQAHGSLYIEMYQSIRDDPYWTSKGEQFRNDRAIQYK